MVGIVTPLPHTEHYHGQIWHYTSNLALVSILDKQRLWASAATMMNDPRELNYGAERIKNWYDREGDTLPDHKGMHMILTRRLRTIVDDIVAAPTYVVSASTDYRVLNQWRNYGSTSGIAIQLEPHADITPLRPPMADGLLFAPQWVKVVYQPAEQDERIKRVLESIPGPQIGPLLKPGELNNANDLIVAMLSSLAASMKDAAYAEEREVRLISFPVAGEPVLHRGTERGVVPYIELIHYENYGWALAGLSEIARASAPLPILGARVGPPQGESERQRKVGVESLFRAHDYDIPVNGSDIAYLP